MRANKTRHVASFAARILRPVRVMLLLAIVLVSVFAWNFARDKYWHKHPASAFRTITKRELPTGVSAIAYAHQMTDAILHTTHYWLLTGTSSSLRQVTNGTGFSESDDAQYCVPGPAIFGVLNVSTQVVAGFEWGQYLERDRWYVIFTGETNAVYAH